MSLKSMGYKPKDRERYRKISREQKNRYYSKTALYKPRVWTDEECKMVLEHSITDKELSNKIKHSVQAIQTMRWKLKKEIAN